MKKLIRYFILTLIIFFSGLSYLYFVQKDRLVIDKAQAEIKEEKTMISCHISGAVKKAGVYELEVGARLLDGLEAAGGFSDGASEEYHNLSLLVEDNEKYYFPYDDEVAKIFINNQEGVRKKTGANEKKNESKTQEKKSPNNKNQLRKDPKKINKKTEDLAGQVDMVILVNINKADKEELMTLKGIGASRANKIIAYREKNNGFKSKEEIMNISGIKEGIYKNIKDRILVE